MSIYGKLANIQKDLFVPKEQNNSFGKYNYRSCEDILKTVKPLCEENQCVLFITNDLQEIGSRIYVKATAKLVDVETGESIESVAHAREEESKKGMDSSQITGASSSYARKYALAGLFSIDNEKDSDSTCTHGKDVKEEKQTVNNYDEAVELAKAKARILKYINDNGKKFPDVFKNYKLTDPSQLTLKICALYINKMIEQGENI